MEKHGTVKLCLEGVTLPLEEKKLRTKFFFCCTYTRVCFLTTKKLVIISGNIFLNSSNDE